MSMTPPSVSVIYAFTPLHLVLWPLARFILGRLVDGVDQTASAGTPYAPSSVGRW